MIKHGWILPLSLATLGLAASDSPVIRVNTQLVEVDVVVDGKHGPAANLTKNDFTILDNGKPQEISLFSVQSSAAGRASGSNKPKAAPLPAGVVSNRLNRNGEEPPSPTVILWDALNTETSDQAWVRNQVIKYLETATPGDPVAVYILVKNLHVIQDFTDDPIPLMQALRRTNAEQSADLSAPSLVDLQGQIASALTSSSPTAQPSSQNTALALLQANAQAAASEMTDYALRDQVYITQAALEAIAEHLSGLPGRKKLVWISGSFPAISPSGRSSLSGGTLNEYLDFTPQIKHSIEALNGANVAVYPIDPRGITTGVVAASKGPTQLGAGGSVPAGALTAGSLANGSLTASGIDTMDLLAGGTGGQDFYSTNDATGAIKTIMEDGQVIYRLGFYPSDIKLDGSYHSLSVKVARKGNEPISGVRFRKGYFALDAKTPTNGHWREKLNESMQNPLEATQLGLRASAKPVEGTNNTYELAVTLDLDGLHLEHVKDRWVASIAFGTLASPSASTKGTLETIRVSLTEARLRAALKDGYTLRRKVVLGTQTADLRVVIEDTATGILGSVSVPFE